MKERVGVHRLDDVDALLERCQGDVYAWAEADPDRIASCWAAGAAVGWVMPSRRFGRDSHLVALGPGEDVAALVSALVSTEGVGSITVPRDVDRQVPGHRLEPRNDWEWMWTRGPVPAQPREDEVSWLGEADWPAVATLLRASPRHDADPGQPGVLRWCGIREGGSLVACAAQTEHRPGWPFLASIATAESRRGGGLGAAVTGWLTRALLAEGHPIVMLGMYSDNDVARRLYLRLGYVIAHEFTSGRLVPVSPG